MIVVSGDVGEEELTYLFALGTPEPKWCPDASALHSCRREGGLDRRQREKPRFSHFYHFLGRATSSCEILAGHRGAAMM